MKLAELLEKVDRSTSKQSAKQDARDAKANFAKLKADKNAVDVDKRFK